MAPDGLVNVGPATLAGNTGADRFFIQSANNTSLSISGGDGADRFYISSNAAKALFNQQGFYDDDSGNLFDSLTGTLDQITANVTIDTGDAFETVADGIYISAAGATAALTDGVISQQSISGLGITGCSGIGR